MRKLIVLFSIVVLVGLASCENSKLARLKKTIKEVNDECPVDMGMIGNIVSYKFDENENEVQINISVDEDNLNIDFIRDNEEMIISSMKLSLLKADDKKLEKEAIDAGVGMSFIYTGVSTGKSHKLTLTLDDLKDIINNNNSLSEKEIDEILLAQQIASVDASCPFFIDEGMKIVRAYDDGNNVVYVALIDEDIYDLETLLYSRHEIKKGMKETFGDPTMKLFIERLKSLGKGLVYRYQGDRSGKSIDITFTTEEL